ncbi:anti-sigma regulatory factor [Spirosoma lituiforme]
MMPTPTIKVTATEAITVQTERDVVQLTTYVRKQAGLLGMSLLDQTKLMTAASELARNMLNYAGGGDVQIDLVNGGKQVGIRLIFMDKGPGIADIKLAMQDAYSTGRGLGLGLPGTKRLVSEFSIDSTVGQGTTVTIIKWTNG